MPAYRVSIGFVMRDGRANSWSGIVNARNKEEAVASKAATIQQRDSVRQVTSAHASEA